MDRKLERMLDDEWRHTKTELAKMNVEQECRDTKFDGIVTVAVLLVAIVGVAVGFGMLVRLGL